MKRPRTRWKDKEWRLPDAINRSDQKDGHTEISNSFIRNPNITAKAKAVMNILLSNKEGSWISYIEGLATMMKEGRDAIKSALTELEQNGYLLRIRFRDKGTKAWKGSFWAYTEIPYNFIYHKNLKIVESKGYEIDIKPTKDNPETESPFMAKPETDEAKNETPNKWPRNGIPIYGKSGINNTNYKNNKLEQQQAAPVEESVCPQGFIFGKDNNKNSVCVNCKIEESCFRHYRQLQREK